MSSVLRKRSRAASQDDDFHIKAAAGDPIPAKSFLIRTFSSCAEQLPAGAEEWDVSGFLSDGEPFSRETIECWLSCGYSILYGAAELDTDDQALLSTAKGLHHVLAFAHAVGSPEGVLKAACSKLQELVIEVQLPARTIEVPVSPADDCAYKLVRYHGESQLIADAVTGRNKIAPNLTYDEVKGIKQQVAAQTAALLHVAHVLHLQPLLDALHRFIKLSTWAQLGIFAGVLNGVFTDVVLEAALGSSTVSKEAYISSVLTQPCSLVDSHLSSQGIFKPLGEFQINPTSGRVVVTAQMLRDFGSAKAGQTVQVTLDLFRTDGMALHLHLLDGPDNKMWLAGRLLLGNSIDSDGQLALVV
jgi:hypothetical protein